MSLYDDGISSSVARHVMPGATGLGKTASSVAEERNRLATRNRGSRAVDEALGHHLLFSVANAKSQMVPAARAPDEDSPALVAA